MIGILGAMRVEVERLIEALEETSRRVVSAVTFHTGRLCGQDVVVAQCGVGKVNAAMCAEAMILTFHPDLIVNIGVAGSFTGRLGLGDVAVARDLVQYDVDSSALGDPVGMVSTVNRIDFPCDEKASALALQAIREAGIKAELVRIASGDRFVDDEATSRLITDTFQADVSEMEGCPIAQVCFINGTRCVVIRAISDTSEHTHSGEYERCRDIAAERGSRALLATLTRMSREPI